MKIGGTLKMEIMAPTGMPWSELKPRMFALRKTAAQALTLTMQHYHAEASEELRAFWAGEASDKKWRGQAYKTLGVCWDQQLQRLKEFRKDDDRCRAYEPVKTSITLETSDSLLSRFSGDHLRDLIAGRASFPSFTEGNAFYAGACAVSISGTADAARVRFPFWGQGKHATELVVSPAGGHARATWRKLVADYERREEVASLEGQLKQKGCSGERRKLIIGKLEMLGLTKLGKVGLKFDERRRKWFALVSYTQYRADATGAGQKAALNFGVNVFIQAVAEDGAEWHEDGDQILAKRIEMVSIRKRIQRSIRTFGSGSKGRGRARRELPLTKRKGDESRFVQTYIRQLAVQIVAWCKRHGVADLYLEDLAGIREQFERATEGQAHEEVKRRIHHWPFYETRQAIERQGAECGVRVHCKGARYVSQRCPDCGHTDPQNVQEIVVPGMPLIHEGKAYRRIEKTSRFECRGCGKRGGADYIACLNHLKDAGAFDGNDKGGDGGDGGEARTPLGKIQEKARKSVSGDKRKKVRRSA